MKWLLLVFFGFIALFYKRKKELPTLSANVSLIQLNFKMSCNRPFLQYYLLISNSLTHLFKAV